MSFWERLFPASKGLTEKEAKDLIRMTRQVRENLDQGGLVPYSSMLAIPVARSLEDCFVINDGIKVYRLDLPDADFLLFDVDMQPGSNFGIHNHDAVERLWVLDGVCTVDGHKVRRFGARKFSKLQEHDVSSEKGCRLLVFFSLAED